MSEQLEAHRHTAAASLVASREQITPELRGELERYARHRAESVRRAGIPVPASYASELIDDIWADTLTGLSPVACDIEARAMMTS